MIELANDDEHGDADHGAESEEFVDEVIRRGVTDERPVELGVEGLAVGLEPDDRTEHEADHDQPVGPADGAELDHLGVRGELDDHLLEARNDRVPALRCRLAEADHVEHPQPAANEDVPAHQGKQRTDRAQRNRQGVHVSGLSFSGSGDYLGSARSAQD